MPKTKQRITQIITISIPRDMLKDIEREEKREQRTRSELFREAFRHYMEEQAWERIYRYGEKRAVLEDIREEEIESLVHRIRKKKS